MFSILNNIPPVTRNLLLLNILMFVLTFVFETQHISLTHILGAHYVNSPVFEPYQIVSHFFMHGDILHILFNMIGVVMLGSFLERLWGPKRFFVFYICCALGAFALYNAMGVAELSDLSNQLVSKGVNMAELESLMKTGQSLESPHPDFRSAFALYNAMGVAELSDLRNQLVSKGVNRAEWERLMKNGQYLEYPNPEINDIAQQYISKCFIPMVGASGAVFGILVAFAILFPNTEFLLNCTMLIILPRATMLLTWPISAEPL